MSQPATPPGPPRQPFPQSPTWVPLVRGLSQAQTELTARP